MKNDRFYIFCFSPFHLIIIVIIIIIIIIIRNCIWESITHDNMLDSFNMFDECLTVHLPTHCTIYMIGRLPRLILFNTCHFWTGVPQKLPTLGIYQMAWTCSIYIKIYLTISQTNHLRLKSIPLVLLSSLLSKVSRFWPCKIHSS